MLKKMVRGVKILISRARGHKGFLDEDLIDALRYEAQGNLSSMRSILGEFKTADLQRKIIAEKMRVDKQLNEFEKQWKKGEFTVEEADKITDIFKEKYDEIAEQINQLESTRNSVKILDKESKKYYKEAEKKQKFLEKTQWHNQKELI